MTAEPFVLDRFQREALAAIDLGHNVLVAAPTGAGKTVVAEHAVARALAEGRRAFYTTPIKALSNQKYADLVRRHGRDQVGLLTGDNAVNPGAGVVVMTTEVLRNMVYASSPALDGLAWVVLDEVHFLQDSYRGPVWEEVIVHTPPSVRFVCLSATVSNADELAGWITAARGPTETVVEHERPVDLVNHFLVYDKGSGDLVQVETLVDGRPNPEGSRFDAPAQDGPKSERFRARGKHRWGTPRRVEVVEHLSGSSLLPAIYFVFSRKGCDDAAKSVLDAGLRLTTGPERSRIRAIVETHVDHLSDGDLAVLGFDRFLAGLEAGAAAHHAGMVPPFKEAVEACFVEGLVKVVFATETLALGINMPARSVVIESLSKFTGEHHEDLTPSQYTQLTGRAGRRGLDPVGHALVLWSPWYGFDKVSALAASREFVLRSAFQPTYNMVVNLVRRYDREQAHELLGRSFAQYQADASLAKVLNRQATRQHLLAEATERATCELGDIDEYRSLRADERRRKREARQGARAQVTELIGELSPGDVVRVAGHRLAILSVSHRKGGLRLRVIDSDARVSVLDEDDFDEPPVRAASISLPEPYNPQNRIFQRQTAAALRKARVSHRGGGTGEPVHPDDEPGGLAEPLLLASDLAVALCPELDAHLTAVAERDRLTRQLAELDRRVDDRTTSLTRRFDAISHILTTRGFLRGRALSERGEVLARTFHESDLLVATVICEGILDGLDEASMAGLVSLLTYEHRSKDAPPAPWYPSRLVRERATQIDRLARKLVRDEEKADLPTTRLPDPTFLALAYAWAAGESFEVVISEEDLSGGDFVRNIKQLIDLLRQVGEVAPVAATRSTARAASDQLYRGIIAASSEVSGHGDAGVCGCCPGVRTGGAVTIEKFQAWGEHGALPADGLLVRSDAEARSIVEDHRRRGAAIPALGLLGGDLCRTVGGRGNEGRIRSEEAMVLPVDLGSVLLDGRQHWFVSHLVARRSWWRGRVVAVMNGQWIGSWDVAPKGHPNDGRLDVLDGDLSLDDRLKVRGRLATGTHVPHPGITQSRVAALQLEFERPVPIWLDGERVAAARTLSIRTEPDALTCVV